MVLMYISLVKLLYHFQKDMGGIWSDSQHRCELISRQRRQQSIIREIEANEACIYCYIDSRLQCLLLPYARKEYPWDTDCDILPHFRNNMNYQPKVVIIALMVSSRIICLVLFWINFTTRQHIGVSV